MNRYLVAWGPALLWAGVLFALSELRSVPEPLAPLTQIPPLLIHVLIYAVLGVALAWARLRTWRPGGPERRFAHLPFLALGFVYGALDEWHQSFVPGRTPSALDWLADVTGVIIGYGVALLLLGPPGGPAPPGGGGGREEREAAEAGAGGGAGEWGGEGRGADDDGGGP